MRSKISFIIFFMLYNLNVFSQEDPTVFAKVSADTIGYYDILDISFEANNYESVLREPVFKDFDTYLSRSTKVEQSLIQGIESSKIIHTYHLKPKRTGTLIIEPAIFENNEKTFETNPVTIQVVGNTQSNNPLNKDNKMFIVANISNYAPYCYQSVTVDYKLYYDDDIQPTSFGYDFESEYKNQFRIYSIATDSTITKEKIGEKEFNCILLKKDVIRFKRLYDTFINNKIMIIYTTKRNIKNVENNYETSTKILPIISERIKTKRFETNYKFPYEINSFGDYNLEIIHPKNSKVIKDKIFEITVKLNGEGFVEDEMIPQLYISKNFEIISNTLKNDRTIENEKIKTVATRTYKIKPLAKGDFTFYPTHFYFYNENKGEKAAISSKEFKLSVK